MNFLRRVLGKIRWWFKWEVLRFPDNVETYGVSYSLGKIFLHWWWYDLKYGVINLVKWFPVIWADRDWDYHFWIRLNIKKLRGMEKSIRNGHHLYGWRDADNIHKAILALERLSEDDYLSNVNMFHDRKYGELKMESEPCSWDEDGKPRLYSIDIKPTKWEELSESEQKMCEFQRTRNYRRAEYLKKQDLEYATKIINKYLFHWWD